MYNFTKDRFGRFLTVSGIATWFAHFALFALFGNFMSFAFLFILPYSFFFFDLYNHYKNRDYFNGY